MLNEKAGSLFQGFSKLTFQQRLQRLLEMGALTAQDCQFLTQGEPLQPDLAEHFIENVIGYFQLPLGVATNFHIDGQDKIIPMAVEETSIIAAVSKTAKWIRQQGQLTSKIHGQVGIGQIQWAKVSDFAVFEQSITTNKAFLINLANQEAAANLLARGGGVTDLQLRRIVREDGADMAVLHVLVDTCDAMGANMITQICEFLKTPLENLTGVPVNMCILSNLADSQLVSAEVTLHDIDANIGENLQEASIFAEHDPYRAATHNKGVLNGIDPVLIATGNDWRAVEAAIHAYACQSGQYRPVSRWRYHNEDKRLTGVLTIPMPVGTVGGMIRLHPMAKLSLKMLDIQHASELARIIAAVGLVQNLGALHALTTVGLTEGHMKLHISNLTLGAGANQEEIPLLKKRLEDLLAFRKRITLTHAIEILNELRSREQSA